MTRAPGKMDGGCVDAKQERICIGDGNFGGQRLRGLGFSFRARCGGSAFNIDMEGFFAWEFESLLESGVLIYFPRYRWVFFLN